MYKCAHYARTLNYIPMGILCCNVLEFVNLPDSEEPKRRCDNCLRSPHAKHHHVSLGTPLRGHYGAQIRTPFMSSCLTSVSDDGYSVSISRIFACRSFLSGKQSLYSATIVGDKERLSAYSTTSLSLSLHRRIPILGFS